MSPEVTIGPKKQKPDYHIKYKINDKPCIGFALSVARSGEKVEVTHRGFFSDYDGDLFFNSLDGITNCFLAKWLVDNNTNVSKIDNCLITISQQNEIEIFINIPLIIEIIAKGEIKGGTSVFKNDIADLRKIDFQGISLPEKKALIFFFSVRWRRGIYFDFLPLVSPETYETGNISTIIASLYSYLVFPEVYRMDLEIKKTLFESGWFPFIQLLGLSFEELISCVRHNLPLEPTEKRIIDQYSQEKLIELQKNWFTKTEFLENKSIIEKGIERYLAKDYISSISILYPRIEGIMRLIYLGEKERASQNALAKKIKEKGLEKSEENGLFLPNDFHEYLKNFYFSSFDLESGKLDLSRHTVAHGLVKADQFSQVKAFQGIMILDQIFFYL